MIKKKPWQYRVTATFAHLDTPELIETNIALLRAQTERPYIVIVDTGSSPENLAILDRIEAESDDVEVHRLRFKAVRHPSDPVAVAMDLAFSLAATEYVYCTHVDCFPMRKDLIEWILSQCVTETCVGYQITDRPNIPKSGWVGHTATMFNLEAYDRLGLAWSQRRLCRLSGMSHEGSGSTSGWPDTEFLVNFLMDREGVDRKIIGKEVNYEPTLDGNIHHVRSYASSRLYSPEHQKKAAPLMVKALQDAQIRIKQWSPK